MKENKGSFYIGYVGNKRSENKFIEPFLNLDAIWFYNVSLGSFLCNQYHTHKEMMHLVLF